MGWTQTSYAVPLRRASPSLRPTRATSGEVNVHQGSTDWSTFVFGQGTRMLRTMVRAWSSATCVNW